MEKTPAAFAMEWSVELEKGLRSKSRAKCIEAISKIGPRLEWWNRQSKVSGAEYKMMGLIPGEVKLFLNAILLRLADAFRTGDRETKYCIVKIFLHELKRRSKRANSEEKKEGEEGIYSKNKLDEYLEILRRVKVVFDDGDVEDRALALYLFGCWADFAKDSADIRYVILSTSVADDMLEVNASLFAAGRFCELADDFAVVFLEMLANRLKLPATSPAFKLAGCRIFAKLQCTFSLACRAHKTGLKLLLDSSNKKFCIAMLISLTKIASQWTVLIPIQLELLSMLLVKDRTLQMQVITLKCLQCVLASGICPGIACRGLIQNLVNVVSESKYSSALLGKALRVLHQILCYYLPTLHLSDMLQVLSTLLTFIQEIFLFSTMSERLFAVWVLLDILGKFLGRDGLESNETASTLSNQLISFVMDRISVLLKLKVDRHQDTEEMEQEVTRLLIHLLNLIENHSDVCELVLIKVTTFMKDLVNVVGDASMEKGGVLHFDSSRCIKEDETPYSLKLVVLLTEMTNTCLENIGGETATSCEVLHLLKVLIDYVLSSATFQFYTRSIYKLLLHLHDAYVCMSKKMNHMTDYHDNYSLSSGDFFMQYDSLIVEYAKKIFERRDYWSFYKAGKHAACHGSWSTATFIFEQLMKLDLSDPNKLWLKSLALFSCSESQLENFEHIAVKGSLLKAGEGMGLVFNLSHYADVLAEACNGLQIARTTLATTVLGQAMQFQKWFLVLRAQVLEIMHDTIGLLSSISLVQDTTSTVQKDVSVPSLSLEKLSSLVHSLVQTSCRLKKAANEYDLLAVSFAGIDTKSAMRLSALAAICSLLAFSTGFTLSIPFLNASWKNAHCRLESSEEDILVMLIQDLTKRLYLIDYETCKSLSMLLKFYEKPTSCFLPWSQNKALGNCYKARGFLELCRYVVMGIVDLKNEAGRMHSDDGVTKISIDGFHMLLRVIWKWMQIPFRCPSRFFEVRNNVVSELFVMDGDGKGIDGTSVSSHSPLSVNVCLQLKNMPPDLPARLDKLYCILSCTMQPPQGENKEQSGLNSEKGETDEILDLNGKLVRYVTTGSTSCYSIQGGNGGSESLALEEYLHFEPNERGQGFSTCFLDISSFPVGIYRIKWHSCFVEKEGSYWSLLPLNVGPSFIIAEPSTSKQCM